MKYLIDTATFIYACTGILQDESSLSQDVMANRNNEIYLSTVSIWEIGIKYLSGKLPQFSDPLKKIQEIISDLKIVNLSLNHNHACNNFRLELHHKDPFDRMIISQAQVEKMPVITPDKLFTKYGVEVIW